MLHNILLEGNMNRLFNWSYSVFLERIYTQIFVLCQKYLHKPEHQALALEGI